MSDGPIVPCWHCGKHACICAPTYQSDSTFSGKPLTDLSLVEVRKMMDSDNGAPKQSSLFVAGRKAGFQAGLKRGAEIVRDHIESIKELASAEVKSTAKVMEHIILREMNDDSSE